MSRDLANSLLVLDRYMNWVSAAFKAARVSAAEEMLPGEKYAALLPDGKTSPGYVLRKKDTREPYVADEAVLFAHVQDTDSRALRDVDELIPEHRDEAMRVLKEHAPHTVTSRVELDPTVLTGYLRAAKADPSSAVPGIGFKTVSGPVAVYADKSKTDALDAAIRDRSLSLESILRIEGGSGGAEDA